MNIVDTDTPSFIAAKICSCKEKNGRRKRTRVTYRLLDSYYSICLDKRDIILAELEACNKLLKYSMDENDKSAVSEEIEGLKIVLDTMS
jgi:hypothetical protein